MKTLVIWGLLVLAMASYGLALAGGYLRAERVREERQAKQNHAPPDTRQSYILAIDKQYVDDFDRWQQ